MAATGYEHVFIREPLDEYICLICTYVAKKPFQVECCGKIFCKTCLDTYRLTQNERGLNPTPCPACRSVRFRSFRDGRGERHILNLEIFCDNKENGCVWEGTIRDYNQHECDFQLLHCSNECSVRVIRTQLQHHIENECKLRSYACPHCDTVGVYCEMSSPTHLNDCPNVTISCSNEDCEETFLRKEELQHILSCPKQVINCPYGSIGCKIVLRREEVQEHKSKSIQNHLDLAVNKITNTQHNIVVAMREYNTNLHNWSGFYSSPFYITPHGYHMCIQLLSDSPYLSVALIVLDGDYDANLQWPCTEVVKVTLLNQLSNNNHHTVTIIPSQTGSSRLSTSSSFIRQFKSVGFCQSFIRFSSFTGRDHTYLKDDTLFFKIALVGESSAKEWLKTTH